MSEEYIRKTDAIKQCGFGMTSLHIANNLRRMPSADVVQAVRCKDCRYFRKFLRECERSGALTMYPLHDTDFCSYGERRE